MTDAGLWAAWRLWVGVAAILVVVAAALLTAIIVTARRILAEAVRALNAAELIQKQTQVIWALQDTNAVAGRIYETVEKMAAKGGALAGALEGAATGGRRAQ